MVWNDPQWFLLLPLGLLFLLVRALRLKKLRVFLPRLRQQHSPLFLLRQFPFVLRFLVLGLLAASLARPHPGTEQKKLKREGLDIILSLDSSASMKAQDFVLNGERKTRFEIIKSLTADFIKDRADDRIGLVLFGSEAFTQAPLSLDHGVVNELLMRADIGVAGNATAIGDGIAVALQRLKNESSKGKIVILLTDGASNAGRIDPNTALNMAKELGVKIYTIGVGSKGEVPIVIDGQVRYTRVDIDEDLMQKLASETKGKYFRATDSRALESVYATIDKLEKRELEAPKQIISKEYFWYFLIAALAVFLVEIFLSSKMFWRLPA